MANVTVPALNIASFITRLRGDSPGPVPLSQILVNALNEIQSWANAIAVLVGKLSALVADVTSTGTVSFVVTNMTVSVNQITNQLVFKVQYSNGTVKTGIVTLS